VRLSACLIVRDEEPRLAAALDSLAGVADEICVLDTGSVDGTVALARARAHKVETRTWREDFAAARNACLELASGDWVLALDADERVATPAAKARAELERFAARSPHCVGRVLVENLEGGRTCGRVRVSRLLPHDGSHRFAGRVHEQIVREGPRGIEQPRRADVAVTLRHIGYELDAQGRRAKLERNATLLERQLADSPEDGYLWFQLGRTQAQSGAPERALQSLERALAHCRDDAAWGIAAVEEGAYALRALGRSEQALALVEQVESQWRTRADTCFLIALLALDLGDLPRADQGFRHCLEFGSEPAGCVETSSAAATFAPAFNLGVISEGLGRLVEAREHYCTALRFHPQHEPSLEGLRRVGR
jgi:tetratricopeptide (TPR) repeat protein